MSEDLAPIAGMPVDEGLLQPLGQVMWAAVRLHAAVREAINAINGAPSDKPFDLTLGSAVKKLGRLANSRVDGPDRLALMDWIRDRGEPAVEARNGVAHAVAITAKDGKQALAGRGARRPARYMLTDLQAVTVRLIEASGTLPVPPYRLRP